MSETTPPPSVVIIGAARSGTNILRDVLVRLPGHGTWPCDEINAIWRHGNVSHPDDELRPEHARPEVIRGIRRAFLRVARDRTVDSVVEKTCANSLRVSFVDSVLPEARYVFIVRDGRDAAASALKRWSASLGLAYTARKARFVPPTDIPRYATTFALNRMHRFLSRERTVATWGPRFSGMRDEMARRSLIEVCALQWRRCVELAEEQFTQIDPARIHRLRYESFVTDPRTAVAELARFLERPLPPAAADEMVRGVSTASIGNWARDLTAEQARALVRAGGDTLERWRWPGP